MTLQVTVVVAESKMHVQFAMINGIKIGIEHVSAEDDEDIAYLIVLDLIVFRFVFIKYR